MKLQYQVVSLELAEIMKKLGFKQDSLFYWIIDRLTGNKILVQAGQVAGEDHRKYSAYTVAELGEMLPNNGRSTVSFYRENKKWFCNYSEHDWSGEDSEDAETEANSRAQMLIYLRENNLL